MKTVCVLVAACWLSSLLLVTSHYIPSSCINKKDTLSQGQNCKKQFYIIKQNVSWYGAIGICDSEDKVLASILDRDEQRTLEEALIYYDIKEPVWVGANDRHKEGEFQWVGRTKDNSPVTMKWSHWDLGQPNNIDNKEHCVEVKINGFWNDASCDRSKYVVCEFYSKGTEYS